MITREQVSEYAEIERLAVERANQQGPRPHLESHFVAIIAGGGTFMLLRLFAALTLPYSDEPYWPVMVLTALVAGGAYAVQRAREKAWSARLQQAREYVEHERSRV